MHINSLVGAQRYTSHRSTGSGGARTGVFKKFVPLSHSHTLGNTPPSTAQQLLNDKYLGTQDTTKR
ncbi:hypothetical protein E2C01_096663 [Portunus trituberculatus]|uniref:Uncharacterized protein n=1 Tax=Portunus trituberculatus TaxID=210409 RepID=A0A5B7K3N3_PORTR|nr:hypothetical protein [Portunus trituberculatus]